MNRRDEYKLAATREVERWPDATLRFEEGAKHQRAIFSFRGRERFVVFASSPSDSRRGVDEFLQNVRAELRTLGAVRREQKRVTTRRERARTPERASPRAPVISDPRPDGMAALRDLNARMAERPKPARVSLISRLFGMLGRGA